MDTRLIHEFNAQLDNRLKKRRTPFLAALDEIIFKDAMVIDPMFRARVQYGEHVLTATKGIKKTKSIIMILGAICCSGCDKDMTRELAGQSEVYAAKFETALLPMTTQQCWDRGAAFQLAMKKAASLIKQ